MNTWGGKRKGAGRRKGSTKETRAKVTAYLLPETKVFIDDLATVSYTHLRAHET